MERLLRIASIRPGEIFRVFTISSLIFFLVAANTLIKIVRDSIFLSHHSASELPYLYILVALLTGMIVASYSKVTASFSLRRLILVTNGFLLLHIVFFWILLAYFDPGWSHYAFYAWSAIAGAVALAQAWTFANEIFSAPRGNAFSGSSRRAVRSAAQLRHSGRHGPSERPSARITSYGLSRRCFLRPPRCFFGPIES